MENTEEKLNNILDRISLIEEKLNIKKNKALNLKFLDSNGELDWQILGLIDCYYEKNFIELINSRFLSKLIFNDKENFLPFLNKINSDFINNTRKQENLIKLGYNNLTSVPIIYSYRQSGIDKTKVYVKQYSDISLISDKIKDKNIEEIILY